MSLDTIINVVCTVLIRIDRRTTRSTEETWKEIREILREEWKDDLPPTEARP